jgi:hypothetical protein
MAPGQALVVGDWVSYRSPGAPAHPDSFGRIARITEPRPRNPHSATVVTYAPVYAVRLWGPAGIHAILTGRSYLEPLAPTDDQVARWLMAELAR